MRRFPRSLFLAALVACLAAFWSAGSAAAPSASASSGRSHYAASSASSLRLSGPYRAALRRFLARKARPRKPSPRPSAPVATRDKAPVPSPQPTSPKPPSPPPQPQPPAPTPAAGPAGGYGVSFDNPEYLDAATRDRELDAMAAMGARWIRFDIKWSDVQWHGQATWDWRKYDPLVDAARARGFTVLANLAYSPTWARPAGTSDKFGPDTAARRTAYATFTAETVKHFAGRVGYWEIWNEPNGSMFWAPKPSASDYTALLRAAYASIKAADSNAFVVAGSTTPAPNDAEHIDEVEFLRSVYASGGAGSFDAWSHHPYTVSPSLAHPDNAWYQMAGTSPSIRGVMAANGDGGKRVWGTEFGPTTGGNASHALSEAAGASQVTEAYTLWRGYSWAGPLFVYTQRDLAPYGASTDSFNYYGMLRNDFSRKPAWDAYRALALGS
jgi:hypothetical protein